MARRNQEQPRRPNNPTGTVGRDYPVHPKSDRFNPDYEEEPEEETEDEEEETLEELEARYREIMAAKKQAEKRSPKQSPRGKPGTAAQKPKSRVTKARFQHVSNPFNEVFAQGTVFRPEYSFTSSGLARFTCSLAIYGGKDEKDNYRPSNSVWVTMWGPAAERAGEVLEEGDWIKVYGQYRNQKSGDRYFSGYTIDWFEVSHKEK